MIILIFTIILIVCTFCRKYLTCKGIQLILLLANLTVLIYCSFKWNCYVLKHQIDTLSILLNPNTWTNITYEITFKINALGFLFIFLVSIIGTATNIYIFNYFKYEEREEEFVLLINWFVLSMIVLVSGNNFFTLILGWELVGLTSFLLINFWKFKAITLNYSFKAFTFNKFSDLLLMVSFCTLYNIYKVNDIDTLLSIINNNNIYASGYLTFSAVCLLISGSVKSAQLIGHLWLPDSMEAPVPASSLIHSATLVSAGIYLLLKFQIIYTITNLTNLIVLLGSVTAGYGGVVAASQSDVKKLLAYSTISHCGFIVTTVGLNNFIVTTVYLYLHGLFKAVTFFCAGSLIKYNNTQDTRMMGMIKFQILNIIFLIICSTNLGGLPFTIGYLYKQLFITSLSVSHFNLVSYGFSIIGLLSSVVYTYKIIYYSCFDYRKGSIQTQLLSLQNYPKLFNNILLNFTYLKLFAFLIIFFYTLMFYIVLKYYILNIYFFFDFLPTNLYSDLKYLGEYVYLKKYLVSIFYVFFTLSIIALVLNSNRNNFFFNIKHNLLTCVLTLLVFYNIVNFFFKYFIQFFFCYFF
jgi:NADH-quinone oxidoreductase subunit L